MMFHQSRTGYWKKAWFVDINYSDVIETCRHSYGAGVIFFDMGIRKICNWMKWRPQKRLEASYWYLNVNRTQYMFRYLFYIVAVDRIGGDRGFKSWPNILNELLAICVPCLLFQKQYTVVRTFQLWFLILTMQLCFFVRRNRRSDAIIIMESKIALAEWLKKCTFKAKK